jgi:hypothetical protein
LPPGKASKACVPLPVPAGTDSEANGLKDGGDQVLSISKSESEPEREVKRKLGRTLDVDSFFGRTKLSGLAGVQKRVRKCLICKYVEFIHLSPHF